VPRAVDLARLLRKAGVTAGSGGFHASRCPTLLLEPSAMLQEAMVMGVRRFADRAQAIQRTRRPRVDYSTSIC
jgi:hypothetical protein